MNTFNLSISFRISEKKILSKIKCGVKCDIIELDFIIIRKINKIVETNKIILRQNSSFILQVIIFLNN